MSSRLNTSRTLPLGSGELAWNKRWQVTEELGKGSFGIVRLEKCTSGPATGQVRAVKELVKRAAVANYYRELEAIAKFSQYKVG